MRPSKGEMLCRLDRLERNIDVLGESLQRKSKNLMQLENLVEELAQRNGLQLVYRNGYYLEPTKEEPYGN